VTFDLGTGVAEWHQHDVAVSDYHSLIKSLGNPPGGPVAPATVSFDITWGQPKVTRQITNEKDKFAGTFADGVAMVSFTAQTGDFYFVSDPGASSQSLLSWLGYESSGVYYPTPLGTPAS
jgi:hypothetical protein